MRYTFALLLLLTACAPKADAPRRAIVTTSSGPVIGVVGPDYFRFDNLPYAGGYKPWATPRDASILGPACSAGAPDSDPCLNLSLITPVGRAHAPVEITFNMAAKPGAGAILAIVHTRPDHPEDQQSALIWIKANIAIFGGDTDHIRIRHN